MDTLVIYAFLLTGCLASPLNRRGNDTSQQQENEAVLYSRIANGLTAARTQFPYQVGLRIFLPHGDIGRCGGSLISPEWVLTAAHCTIGCNTVSVRIGSTQFENPQIKFQISNKHIKEHRGFNKERQRNDIAVIKIHKVSFSDTIAAARLPVRDSIMPEYDGVHTVLAGWGRTSFSSPDFAHDLQYFTFQTIKNEKCAETFGTLPIYEGKICTATPKGIGGCVGDSGSPLVLLNDNLQIGIFAFHSARGCELGLPNAFTRVSFYLDWIKRKTGLNV